MKSLKYKILPVTEIKPTDKILINAIIYEVENIFNIDDKYHIYIKDDNTYTDRLYNAEDEVILLYDI